MNCHSCGSDNVIFVEEYASTLVHLKNPDTNELIKQEILGIELMGKYYQCETCDKWFELDDKGRMVFH